jgi:hypothetical protein
MEKREFLNQDETSLYSNCCVYNNPEKGTVHLIPVVHLGMSRYYQNLLEYVGDLTCIYENIKLESSDGNHHDTIKSVDEYFRIMTPHNDVFWEQYKDLILRFYKKRLTRKLKKLRKEVHQAVNESDEKIKKILEMSEKSFFGIQNIFLAQLYWGELMNLSHQFAAIDYQNDIKIRSNWVHADLDVDKQLKDLNVDPIELLELILTEPTPELLEIRRKEIEFILYLIYASIEMYEMPYISQRRRDLASAVIQTVNGQSKVYEQVSPDYMIQGRNEIVENAITDLVKEHKEVVVFFGAVHQVGIERFLLEQNYFFESQNRFEVFNFKEEN